MKTGRFDNPSNLLTAEEACARLEVKRATLYSYASRHKIRTVKVGRTRRYHADDVERLRVMSAARRGHAAVAGGALRWGEPVLDSALTSVVDGRLRYRGRDVVGWWNEGAQFEEVVAHLWQADPAAPWPALPSLPASAPSRRGPVWRMARALLEQAEDDPRPHGATLAREHARGRALIAEMAATLRHGRRRAPRRERLAARVARQLGHPGAARLVEAILVLLADHELNVSTFAVRVASSAGADLYAAVGAGLYAFSGPRHGASTERVAALLDEADARGARRAVDERLGRGETLPGFGHPLYPDGDPRTPPLFEALRLHQPQPALGAIDRLVREVGRATDQRPNVDLGVVAVCRALGLPPQMGSALFALGRSAGWIAHALEQRESPALLRPRARYVGP